MALAAPRRRCRGDTPWPGGTIDARRSMPATLAAALYRVTADDPGARRARRELTLLYPAMAARQSRPARADRASSATSASLADGKPLELEARSARRLSPSTSTLPEGARDGDRPVRPHLAAAAGSEGRITMTQEMLNLQWEKMSLYPAGHYVRRIAVQADGDVPRRAGRLHRARRPEARRGDTVDLGRDRLRDAGRFADLRRATYAQSWDLGQNVQLNAVADKPEQLALAPREPAGVQEPGRRGRRAVRRAAFRPLRLPARADRPDGRHRARASPLEREPVRARQRSPTGTRWTGTTTSSRTNWCTAGTASTAARPTCGRPITAPRCRDDLLWVYEGQTQFWGWVLAARSGMQSKDTVLGQFAARGGDYCGRPAGPRLAHVEDTTLRSDRRVAQAACPTPRSQRSEDYYIEGALIWLEADQIIRKGTGGAKGLDDFAHGVLRHARRRLGRADL